MSNSKDILSYSDIDLIKGCIDDDRHFQEALYKRFANKMYNISLTYSFDEQEASDIMQEGFIKVFRNIHTFNNNGSLEGWVRKIIVNTALDFYRKRKRKDEVFENNYSSESASVEGVLDNINAKDIVRLVNQLPIKASMVLKLYAIEGYNHKEIAEIMEISEGTSKSQLNRARILLKEAIAKKDGQ